MSKITLGVILLLQGMTAMEEIAAMEEDTGAAMEAAAELMGAEAATEAIMTGLFCHLEYGMLSKK